MSAARIDTRYIVVKKFKRVPNVGGANNTRWQVIWDGGRRTTAPNMETAHLTFRTGIWYQMDTNGRGQIVNLRPAPTR